MKSEELKSLQAPLKEAYKKEPSAALITLRSSGKIGEGITCKVGTGQLVRQAGLHPATGGNGLSLCSGDMLLDALVACAGVTLNAVAISIGIDLADGEIIAEGDLDFRGTLGVSKEAPVGFKNIRLNFNLSTSSSEEEIKNLIRLTERYCVVFQTLAKSPGLETSFKKV